MTAEPASLAEALAYEQQRAAGTRPAPRMTRAQVGDLMPTEPAPRFRWLRLPRRRPRGLVGLPERYRLQILLLAAGCLPGGSPAAIQALADRVAGGIKPPAHLLAKNPEKGLDAWFKDRAEWITDLARELAA